MTRKDYVLIAQAIKGTIPGPEHTEDYLQGQAVGWRIVPGVSRMPCRPITPALTANDS